jgi:hypothetical protein
MPDLVITDIRKSHFDSEFDLITAVILNAKDHDHRLLSPVKKSCSRFLVFEGITSEEELTVIGVRKGDQFIRVLAELNHGLNVGDGIDFAKRT